jgi:hypothetical protein
MELERLLHLSPILDAPSCQQSGVWSLLRRIQERNEPGIARRAALVLSPISQGNLTPPHIVYHCWQPSLLWLLMSQLQDELRCCSAPKSMQHCKTVGDHNLAHAACRSPVHCNPHKSTQVPFLVHLVRFVQPLRVSGGASPRLVPLCQNFWLFRYVAVYCSLHEPTQGSN